MKKPLEEEDTLLQAGIIETSDVPAISITNNKAISSIGSVGPTTTTTCLVTKFDFNLM
jgi:hypothetical protein